MSTVNQLAQSIFDARLDLVGVERSPDYVGQYGLTNQLANSLAHLVATDGQYSRLLTCTTGGVLLVEDSTLKADLDTIAQILSTCYNAGKQALQTYAVT